MTRSTDDEPWWLLAETVDKLARREDLDRESVWIDREEVVAAGDDRGRLVGCRKCDEVVVVRVAVGSWVIAQPTARHASLVRGLFGNTGMASDLTTAANLAALAIEHGADVVRGQPGRQIETVP